MGDAVTISPVGILPPSDSSTCTITYSGYNSTPATNEPYYYGSFGSFGSNYCTRKGTGLGWSELKKAYWEYLRAFTQQRGRRDDGRVASTRVAPQPVMRLNVPPATTGRLRPPLPSSRAQRRAIGRLLRA